MPIGFTDRHLLPTTGTYLSSMDQSRESLQTRIQALKDPSVRELVRDVVDSAWQWSRGQVGKQAQERWVIVGGQAVRGTTENEKAPPQNGGQSDGQGQTQLVTGAAGPAGPIGPIGPAGPVGPPGEDFLKSIGLSLGAAMDGIADVTNSPLTESGEIEIELADQTQGKALMSPVSGTGKPAFRQIVQSDIFAGMESSVLTLNSILSNGEVPPPSPSVGFYGLAYGMTGVFLGYDNKIAYWNGAAWAFSMPFEGQKAYLISNSGVQKAGFKRWIFPQWITVTQNELFSEDIRGTSVMVGGQSGEVVFSPFSHPNAAAKVTGILVFDRANIETTGIAFKTAGSSKYVSISGSDVNEREVDLRGFSTGIPLDEGVWTSLRLLNIKAINGVFTGSTPTERITALGAGFLTSLAISGLTSGALPRATAGGLLADSCFGDDGANARCTRQLTLNGAVRPAWAIGATVLDSLSSVWQSIGKNFRFGRNVYYASDTQFKAIESATGTNFPSILSQMADGSLNYATSTADPVAGSTVSMTTKFQVGKEGGVGAFGVTPPTTRPTANAAATDLATAIALTNQLREAMIGCGIVQ